MLPLYNIHVRLDEDINLFIFLANNQIYTYHLDWKKTGSRNEMCDKQRLVETHVDDPVLGVVGVGATDVEAVVGHGLDDPNVVTAVVFLKEGGKEGSV